MITIAGHEIGREPFLIAEVGINHNGSLDRALEMIGAAKAAGVDCVKFQTFKAEGVCSEDQMYTYTQYWQDALQPLSAMLGRVTHEVTEPRINIFRRCELPDSAWWELKRECDRQGIVFMSTPQNPSDLDLLLRVGIPAIKIGSDDLTNLPMLRYCARDDVALPIILSTGMCTAKEISAAIVAMNGANIVLLVCSSEYPCPPESANLARISKFKRIFPAYEVGFSDHTIGSLAAGIAAGLGACVFECHFTLDHNLAGPDHWWSKTPSELAAWASAIREAHVMLGDGVVRPSAKELENKARYQRTVPA